MRSFVWAVAIVFVAAGCLQPLLAEEPSLAALEARAAQLRQAIAELQEELNQVQDQIIALSPRALTPHEALAEIRRRPEKPVTVEFGVEHAGPASGLVRTDDEAEPPILARWDNYFEGGGTLTAVLPANVYRQLMLPTKDGTLLKLKPNSERQQVLKHIEENGIRVTGVMQVGEGFAENDYVIEVEDPANVTLYIKAPQ